MLSSEPIIIISALAILTLGTTFGWVLARGKAVLMAERMAKLESSSKLAEQRLEQAAKDVVRANELARREKRRADEQFKVIEDATRETQAVWTIYRRQSIGAGNAQAWLFRELSAIGAAYNKQAKVHGFKPYQVPKELQAVISTYREEHLVEENAVSAKNSLVAERREQEQAIQQALLIEGQNG